MFDLFAQKNKGTKTAWLRTRGRIRGGGGFIVAYGGSCTNKKLSDREVPRRREEGGIMLLAVFWS